MHRATSTPQPIRRTPGRRSSAEAAQTRIRLLRRAEQVFARKGYGATSLRELARASGVRMFTIQHHFGSKRRLYEEILRQWDRDVEQIVAQVLAETTEPRPLVQRTIERLFDFFVANRARLSLNARAALGEGLPRQLALSDRSWLRFMRTTLKARHLGTRGLDPGLLLITIEGVLHHHILATTHYRQLFGRDLTNPVVAKAVKDHLTRVILTLLGPASGTKTSLA
ncbi:MAG: TetR/AcrR family transcriptional regulator [Deltaproteobacteria bacterium]|nr:TetR/AcrR family transcriptional regulator [Deltaproteobacteria bacterium]MBI3386112.1 TetR/AcrR family transcriptional regulator [Deltaproteobacteria bacterium]